MERGTVQQMATRYCSQCGTEVGPAAGFCGQCGAALRAQPDTGFELDGVVQYAGFWIRLLALIVDGIVLSIVTNPITLAIGQGFEFETTQNAAGEVDSFSFDFDGTRFAITTLISIVIPAVYYTIALSRWGQTIGALAVSIKVVRPDGGLLSPGAAFIRWLGSIVSVLILWIGYLMMLWDSRRQTLHDKLAGSVVVKVKRRGEP